MLVIGSGNVVHNLRRVDWAQPEAGFEWARRPDDAARDLMGTAPGDVVHLRDHTDFGVAVPTPDHFIPLLYIAGLATAAGRPADVLVDGYAMGSLSMTAYSMGMQADTAPDQTDGAPPLPHLPADETTV